MQIAVEFLAFAFSQRARPRHGREVIHAVFVAGRQPYREEIAGGVRSEFPVAGLNHPCENRGFGVWRDELRTHGLFAPLSSIPRSRGND